jgi:hypothetical protein
VYLATPLPLREDKAEEKDDRLLRTLGALIPTGLTKRLLLTVTVIVYPTALKSKGVSVHFSILL